jgi:phage shock protein A
MRETLAELAGLETGARGLTMQPADYEKEYRARQDTVLTRLSAAVEGLTVEVAAMKGDIQSLKDKPNNTRANLAALGVACAIVFGLCGTTTGLVSVVWAIISFVVSRP